MPAKPCEHYEIGFRASGSAAKMLTIYTLCSFTAQLGLEKDSTIP